MVTAARSDAGTSDGSESEEEPVAVDCEVASGLGEGVSGEEVQVVALVSAVLRGAMAGANGMSRESSSSLLGSIVDAFHFP